MLISIEELPPPSITASMARVVEPDITACERVLPIPAAEEWVDAMLFEVPEQGNVATRPTGKEPVCRARASACSRRALLTASCQQGKDCLSNNSGYPSSAWRSPNSKLADVSVSLATEIEGTDFFRLCLPSGCRRVRGFNRCVASRSLGNVDAQHTQLLHHHSPTSARS